jgi:hypothetical protein
VGRDVDFVGLGTERLGHPGARRIGFASWLHRPAAQAGVGHSDDPGGPERTAMRYLGRMRAVIAAILLVTASVVAVGSAAPARAAGPCSWNANGWGTASNCDNKPSDFSNCRGSMIDLGPSYRKNLGGYAQIELRYSTVCRTTWASITINDTPSTPSGNIENCYVKVQRNSDDQAYRFAWNHNLLAFWPYTTTMVYDADVTSYAWGYCDVGATVYTAQTPSY